MVTNTPKAATSLVVIRKSRNRAIVLHPEILRRFWATGWPQGAAPGNLFPKLSYRHLAGLLDARLGSSLVFDILLFPADRFLSQWPPRNLHGANAAFPVDGTHPPWHRFRKLDGPAAMKGSLPQ
jgi:hypothetical protein